MPLVPHNWQLPESFKERLGNTVGRQRCMVDGVQLLLVLHRVPNADEATRHGVLFWLNPDGKWVANDGQFGIPAIQSHLSSFGKVLDELDQMEAAAMQADQYLAVLDRLNPVQRTVRNLLEVFSEARKALPENRELIDLRDQAYDLSRTAELLYTDTKHAMDVAVIKRAEEQSKLSRKMAVASHRLNLLVAVFFPLATLGTILGTTLTENWSWSRSSLPFLLFLLAGIMAGVLLAKLVVPETTET